jgi:cytochrome c peroxidase
MEMKKPTILVLMAACCVTLASVYVWHRIHLTGQEPAGQDVVSGVDKVIGAVMTLKTPLGLPPIPVPGNNPVTAEKVALGRALFYDKRLSSDNTVSCSSCHNPLLGFTDGSVHSTGVGGKTGKRNAISLLNAAYDPVQFWDGRAPTLEAQVGTPMEDPSEMNQPHAVAITKLEKDAALQKEFDSAFGPGPITIGKIQQAIASFERMLISGNSAFDRYQFGGDKTALSPAAIRGLAIFQDKSRGNCATCHSINSRYALFTDGKFHNTGEGVDEEGNLTDPGRYGETKAEADRGAFKTPSLRNVAESAPYMHDGRLKTLDDVVQFYAGGGNSNPYLDKDMKPIPLSARDRADLIEFLKSLSGEPPANVGPPQAAK